MTTTCARAPRRRTDPGGAARPAPSAGTGDASGTAAIPGVEGETAGAERGGEQPRAGAGPEGLRARVLVVDDDRVDRMAVRRHLAHVSGEITVDEADGVLAAIDRLAGEPFDCVILDYNLPDGDGLTFLRGMRAAGLEVPVVMLTGQEDADVARDLMISGAACYIPKAQLSAGFLLTCLRDAMQARP